MPRAAEAKSYVPERGSAPPLAASGRELVAEEEVVAGAAHAEQARRERAARQRGRRPRRAPAALLAGTRPTRSGEIVRKSSSTSPAARNGADRVRAALGEDEPVARGSCSAATASAGSSALAECDDSRSSASLPARRSAPASVVSDERAGAKAGWAGSIRPLRRDDRDARAGAVGRAARRSSANASAAAG